MKNNWPTKKLGELISFEKGKKMITAIAGEPYIGIDGLRTNQYAVYTQEKKGVRCKPDDVLLVWDGAHAGTVGTGLNGFVGSTIVKVLKDNSLDNNALSKTVKCLKPFLFVMFAIGLVFYQALHFFVELGLHPFVLN